MVTEATRVRKHERGRYDRDFIDSVLDEGTIAHVGLVAADGRPVVIPMLYARDGDRVLLHGSPATRLLRAGKKGVDVCVTVTILDALVLARSAFHHSMNYRSVVLLGRTSEITEHDEKVAALDRFTEHLVPGRLEHLRPMTDIEIRGTTVVSIPIDEASAKTRTGDPIDDEEDLTAPVWAGLLPLSVKPAAPIPSGDLRTGIGAPPHVTAWGRGTTT